MDPRDIFLSADGFTGEAVVQCDVQVIENTFGGRWFQINDTNDIQMIPNKFWGETYIIYCFCN